MKTIFIILLSCIIGITEVSALTINEVMSNPVGDDGGREWIELYNESDSAVDVSTLTISIKGGNAIVTTSLQGGTSLAPHAYAIVGSTVSSATKFLQDYPAYSGMLLKSSLSLVNTGVTSIDIKLQGQIVDSLSSYTAAKEGFTLSKIHGSFVVVPPTPGEENKSSTNTVIDPPAIENATTTANANQVTIAQMSPPSADIILYAPFEKVVVAGADSEFAVYATNRAGDSIKNLVCTWAFGDGGQGFGTSTLYRYVYTGMYSARTECSNGLVAGDGLVHVRVVTPDITIKEIGTGKYGSYIDVMNPNTYDIDFSQWKFSIGGVTFPFPKNTTLGKGVTTRFSGIAMGFASTTISSSTPVKILFPNMEEVTAFEKPRHYDESVYGVVLGMSTSTVVSSITPSSFLATNTPKAKAKKVVMTTTQAPALVQVKATSSISKSSQQKDTRIASFLKSFFGRN